MSMRTDRALRRCRGPRLGTLLAVLLAALPVAGSCSRPTVLFVPSASELCRSLPGDHHHAD